jgi:hypothetical protein
MSATIDAIKQRFFRFISTHVCEMMRYPRLREGDSQGRYRNRQASRRRKVHGRAIIAVIFVFLGAIHARAQSTASQDYQHDCAACHGADGKGSPPWKRAVPGYISIDLTQISARNGGQFPRQKIFDAIDGRSRITAHFSGDMPRWGSRYRVDEKDQPVSEQRVKERISGLVDYLDSIQEK